MSKTAQNEWHQFVKDCKLDAADVPQHQRDEMQKAFFAGQYSMILFLLSDAVCAGSEDAGASMLETRKQSLEAYFRSLLNHRN